LPSMITGNYNERLSPEERNGRPFWHLLPPRRPTNPDARGEQQP
jgi:hypothetical protein